MVRVGVYSVHACPLFQQVKSPGLWDKFDLYSILDEGINFYKSIDKFRDGSIAARVIDRKLLYECGNSRK